MLVYKLVWEDRNKKISEWIGTKQKLKSRKEVLNRLAVKRPYDFIAIIFSGPVVIPAKKEELLLWLNKGGLR